MLRRLTKFSAPNCYRFSGFIDQFFSKDDEELGNRAESKNMQPKKKRSNRKNLDIVEHNFTPKKDVTYAYEVEGIVPVPRQVYKTPLKSGYKEFLQNKEYKKFLAAAIEGTMEKKQSITPEQADELWNGDPPRKLFFKTTTKELYFNYREPQFTQINDRKNGHLKWFAKPYKVTNQELRNVIDRIKSLSSNPLQQIYDPNYFIEEDFYAKDPDVIAEFKKLAELVTRIQYTEIPHLALSLAFDLRYKIDVHKLWNKLEPIIVKHIHHYTVEQLCQIKYALGGTFPKVCEYPLHRQLLDLTTQELHSLNTEQLNNVMTAFRTLPSENFSDSVIEQIKKNKIDSPDLLADTLYSILNSQPKKHQRILSIDLEHDLKKRQSLMDHFLEPIKSNINQMSLDSLVRLALSIQLIRLPNYDDVYLLIENSILKNLSPLDEFHVSQLLYSFSKGNNGYSVGSNQFYELLSPFVSKYWNQWGNLTKSRVYYAYCSNQVIIEKDQQSLYNPWIEQQAAQFSYSELQNVVYGLMFTNNSNKQIWREIIRNIGYQPDVAPTSNLFALKQAYQYIQMFYPSWNLNPFLEAMGQAEYHFSAMRYNTVNEEVRDLLISLSVFFDYNWESFYDYKNLYILYATLKDYKIALLLNNSRNSFQSGKPRPQLLLQQQILEADDWKAPIIDYREMMSLSVDQRKEHLDKIIKQAIEEQKPKYRRWEEEKRTEIYRKLHFIDRRITTVGKQRLTMEDAKILERKIE